LEDLTWIGNLYGVGGTRCTCSRCYQCLCIIITSFTSYRVLTGSHSAIALPLHAAVLHSSTPHDFSYGLQEEKFDCKPLFPRRNTNGVATSAPNKSPPNKSTGCCCLGGICTTVAPASSRAHSITVDSHVSILLIIKLVRRHIFGT
jgi:hypothetical protein